MVYGINPCTARTVYVWPIGLTLVLLGPYIYMVYRVTLVLLGPYMYGL